MKLPANASQIVTFLYSANPNDPLLGALNVLSEGGMERWAESPTNRATLVKHVDLAVAALVGFKGALSVEALAPVATPSTAGNTAQEKVILWLRANPGEHTPGAVRQALAMPSGTFGESLKTLRDSGAVLATGQGAGRKIQATEKK